MIAFWEWLHPLTRLPTLSYFHCAREVLSIWMDHLLLERKYGAVTPIEFATSLAEALFGNLKQQQGRFPANCHRNAAVNSLALETQQYRFMLSGSADSLLKLWDISDMPEATCAATVPRKCVHQFGISAVAWWPHDTGMFVTGSFDRTVNVWDTNELAPVHTFDMDHRVYALDIAQGRVAVACDQPFVRILDLRLASSAHTLLGHKGKTLAVKWHPQHQHLLATGGFDGEVKVWDTRRANSCLCRLDMLRTNTGGSYEANLTRALVKAHLGPVNGILWDDLGTTIYTAGNDDKVRVWDCTALAAPPINKLINFGPLTRNKYPQTIPLVLNPNRETEVQYMIFPSDNGDVYVYNTLDGKLVSRLSRAGDKSGRASGMVYGEPFTGTLYCGSIDGDIVAWQAEFEKPRLDDIIEHTLEKKVRLANLATNI